MSLKNRAIILAVEAKFNATNLGKEIQTTQTFEQAQLTVIDSKALTLTMDKSVLKVMTFFAAFSLLMMWVVIVSDIFNRL